MALDPSIVVASIGAVALVTQTWVASRHARQAKDTALHVSALSAETHAIVKGNGHGNVLAIVERIEAKVDSALSWQGAHDALHLRTHQAAEQAATSAHAAVELIHSPARRRSARVRVQPQS